ncbi:RNA polymerase sigma factor [Paenibacillus sp. GCM10027626]|uniref:RNA polymerase sigma factor n=1 Tax=Paenibacillus sp. GCM10027626 TaxID=3273411 RepID=UPI0036351108
MEQMAANLDELYEMHSGYLNKYMLNLTRNREEAADLVQEIFLRLCQQERLPEHPKSWLSQTGYRLFIDQWRRKQRFARILPEEQAMPDFASPEQAVLDREFERRVRQLLLGLSPQTRTAIYMRVYEHASYIEISRRLGCPVNTVKSKIRRGRVQLSKWL